MDFADARLHGTQVRDALRLSRVPAEGHSRAAAHLQASIMTRSSMRESFTGGEVGCTKNTSQPRIDSCSRACQLPAHAAADVAGVQVHTALGLQRPHLDLDVDLAVCKALDFDGAQLQA